VTFPHPAPCARAARDRLIVSDPDLAGIEQRAGPHRCARFYRPATGDRRAADQQSGGGRLWGRLRAIGGVLELAGLQALTDESRRANGLARPKIADARVLAQPSWMAHLLLQRSRPRQLPRCAASGGGRRRSICCHCTARTAFGRSPE
jgi:hypothetical protein